MGKNPTELAGNNVGPVNKKYGPKPIQVAFKTSDYKQRAIPIGGLTECTFDDCKLEGLTQVVPKPFQGLMVQFGSIGIYPGHILQHFRVKSTRGNWKASRKKACPVPYTLRTWEECLRCIPRMS